ncbi:MAG: hypothetical protein Kow0075_01670 [Salibacteraceae bacterium]
MLDRHRIYLYQNYLLYGIAFFMPLFPRIVPLLILAFGALSVYAILRGFSRAQLSEISVLLIGYYLLHVAGMVWTENIERGLFELEVKLSLLAFPLAFVGFKFVNTTNYTNVLRMFLFGTLAACVICIAQSAYQYFFMHERYFVFFTSGFSFILHPSYMAMYVLFSMAVLCYLEWPVIHRHRPAKSLVNVFLLLFLSVCVVLTASKIGFIMLVLTGITVMVLLLRDYPVKWVPIAMFIVVASVIGWLFQSSPILRERIMLVVQIAKGDKEVRPDSRESTAARALIYETAWEAVTTQPWYGRGTGDHQEALDQLYLQKGYSQPLKRRYNAHNLLLQSWLTLGIPGLVLILGIFILMFIQSISTREWIYIAFTSLFFLISLTESSLNVQAGVTFFSFFAVLFSRRAMSIGALGGEDDLEQEVSVSSQG